MKIHLLLAVALTSIFSSGAIATTAAIEKTTIVEGLKRGTLGKLPTHLVVADASFTETSRVDTEVTLKGEAIFTATEDSFVAVRRLGVKRPSGELNATIIRRIHATGDRFTAPFQAVVSLLDPAPRLVPTMSVSEQGQPRSNFKAAVIEGSAEHQQLLALNEAFTTTDERFQRVKEKWENLQKVRALVGSYDEFTSKKWDNSFFVGQLLEKALDSSELRKAYTARVSNKRAFPNRPAQHAAFVQLVKPALDPEYARIKAISDPREAAAKAYLDFLEKL